MTHISISGLSKSGNIYKSIDDTYIDKRDKILSLISSYNNLSDTDAKIKLEVAQELKSKVSHFKIWYFCMPSRDRCKYTPVSYSSSAGFSSGSAPFASVSSSTSSYKTELYDELKSAESILRGDIQSLQQLTKPKKGINELEQDVDLIKD